MIVFSSDVYLRSSCVDAPKMFASSARFTSLQIVRLGSVVACERKAVDHPAVVSYISG